MKERSRIGRKPKRRSPEPYWAQAQKAEPGAVLGASPPGAVLGASPKGGVNEGQSERRNGFAVCIDEMMRGWFALSIGEAFGERGTWRKC